MAAGFPTSGADSNPFGAGGLQAKGYKLAQPHAPPNETRTKSLLEGGKVVPLGDGRRLELSEGVTFRSFSLSNTVEIIVATPQCLYDSSEQSASSSGALRVQTGDGQFSIEGEGFRWRQKNSSLVISNRVHTTAVLEERGPSGAAQTSRTNATPVHIFSDQFAYDSDSGKAVYGGHVRAAGTNLDLTCGRLVLDLPLPQRQLEELVAEESVVLTYAGIRGYGQKLEYAPKTEVALLSGQPSWRDDQFREGGGERLIIDRANRLFRAEGRAWLRLPARGFTTSGLLVGTGSGSAPPPDTTHHSVEVQCDWYEFRTNLAVFHSGVRMVERLGVLVQSTLSCERLAVAFSGTNELQQMDAEKDVIIDRPANRERLTGGRAVFYPGSDGFLELTDRPAWEAGARRGRATRIRLTPSRNELAAHGNASLRLPAAEVQEPGSVLGGTNTTRASPPATDLWAEIFSESYTLRPELSTFHGGVYATHPQMNWACEQMAVEIPGTGLTNIIAESGVVFDVASDKGPVHGTGDRAVYTFGPATNGLVLVGNPARLTNETTEFENTIILVDRLTGELVAPGDQQRWQRLRGRVKVADTNIFPLPTGRSKK